MPAQLERFAAAITWIEREIPATLAEEDRDSGVLAAQSARGDERAGDSLHLRYYERAYAEALGLLHDQISGEAVAAQAFASALHEPPTPARPFRIVLLERVHALAEQALFARRRTKLPTLLAAAALLIGALAIPTLAADSPSASDPSIVHEPQLTAFEGRSIPISLIASCGQGAECAAALYWRATPRESEPAESWSRASLEQGGRTTAPAVGEDAVEWGGEIPAADVGTRGVDYFIEVAEDDQLGHLPLDGSDGTVGSYFHVRTLSPPLATHIPAAFAQVDRPLELQINSSCSTAECTAKIFYRTTDGPLSDEPVVTDPDWDSVTMDQSGEPVSLGEAGELAAYSGEIPAEAVDTRGVDYFIRVSDGTVKTYLPGTSYQGYYLPTDGKRIGYVHVHGLEPPQIVHEPVAASPYREPVRVKATSNCPATRECSAELYWRTTDKDVIETTGSDFESAPMEVRRVGEGTLPPDLPIGEDNEVIEVVGEIPAAAADTRGLDYFFSISDGSTTSWWPGTSSVDGYVPVQGTRVGYEHVRVLDPPHLIPHPLAATPALSAYEVTANLTCATESCEVTLHYNDDPRATDVAGADPGRWQSMPMQPGPIAGLEQLETPLGVASTYAATIPAEEVTTRGLAYYIEVFDGYVHAYAPGSEYQGAYVPADGTRGDQISGDGTSVGLTFQGEDVISGDGGITGPDLAFPVRVLEPPHVVHVPPAAPQRAVATAIEARSNCATPECRARLHWRLPNGQWESERMSGGLDSSVSGDQALWSYEGELPAAATDVAVAAYRISVHDGYATESSPTYTVATSSVEDTDTGPLPVDPPQDDPDPTSATTCRVEEEGEDSVEASPVEGAVDLPYCMEAATSLESVAATPHPSLAVETEPAAAEPGEPITHTATISNGTDFSLDLAGFLSVRNSTQSELRIAAYTVALEYRSRSEDRWVPIAVAAGVESNYEPRRPAPEAGPLELDAEPGAGSGHAQGEDPILGAIVSPAADVIDEVLEPSRLSWTIQTGTETSTDEAAAWTDPKLSDGIRLRFAAEGVRTDDGAGEIESAGSSSEFTAALAGQDASVRDIALGLDAIGGQDVTIGPEQDPGLAHIGPGEQVSVELTDAGAAPEPRGESEGEADYVSRLQGFQAQQLGGEVSAEADLQGPASSAESAETGPQREIALSRPTGTVAPRLPILSLQKTGPDTVQPGTQVTYPIELDNSGGGGAQQITLTDRLLGGSEEPVADRPQTLAAGASATAHALVDEPRFGPSVTDTAELSWQDGAGNEYGPLTDSFTSQIEYGEGVAPPSDPNGAAPLGESSRFLYTGSNAPQQGVVAGTIDPARAGVIRGLVTDAYGSPLAEITTSVVDHPEYGTSASHSDGTYAMAVNGGATLRVRYEADGYLPVERQLSVSEGGWAWADDVAMTELDDAVTEVDLESPADAQLVLGSEVSDSDGTRRYALIMQPATTAQLVMPDGTTQALDAASVRATEYTTGPLGQEAMPGPLPPTSAYTYAVELSADEAIAAGAAEVQLSQPAAGYVDNFLGLPVGEIIPNGYYDSSVGMWIPALDGRVVEVLSESGGEAVLDVIGSGNAATSAQLDAMSITGAELEVVAATYEPGDELWRSPIPHFTPWDHNDPAQFPAGATSPDGAPPVGDAPCSGTVGGSVIECEAQVLGEDVPITGSAMQLHYRSSRSAAREPTLTIPISGATVPAPLKRIDLEIRVAGQRHQLSFPPDPDQSYEFEWDGRDGFGREIQGRREVEIAISNVYDGVYASPTPPQGGSGVEPQRSFGSPPSGALTQNTRGELLSTIEFRDQIENFGASGMGLGGFTLSDQHVYDPVSGTLFMGTGERVLARAKELDHVSGGGNQVPGLTPIPSEDADVGLSNGVQAIDYGPDGSLFMAHCSREQVYKQTPDGKISVFAGTGNEGNSGDGGPATAAQLDCPKEVTVAPDGSVYISDLNEVVRKVDGSGTITTVAGGGSDSSSGVPATSASLSSPWGLEIGPDGSLYIKDHSLLKRVDPTGTITTIAGQGNNFPGEDPEPANDVFLGYNSYKIAVADDGTVYVAGGRSFNGFYSNRIFAVTPDGQVGTYAWIQPQGTPGRGRRMDDIVELGGSLYVASAGELLGAYPDGTVTTVAGGGATPAAVGDPPRGVNLAAAAIAADGSGRLAVARPGLVLRLDGGFPRYSGETLTVPSRDRSLLYEFTASGKHLRTLDADTGVTLLSFTYDADGLQRVIDADGLETEIERNAAGEPTAITAPYGQRTELGLDADGLLERIENPAGEATTMSYATGGLLASFTNPRGKTSTFDYNGKGRLLKDTDAAGGFKTLTRSELNRGFEVALQTKLGRTTNYKTVDQADGDHRREITDSAGLTTTITSRSDGGARTVERPDGSIETTTGSETSASSTVAMPSGAQLSTSIERQITDDDPDLPGVEQIQTTTTVAGASSSATYDPTTGVVEALSAEGRAGGLLLDSVGRPLSEELPDVEDTAYSYDSEGRLEQVIQGDRTWTYTYDSAGYLQSVTDPVDRTTSFAYDAAGRLDTQTLPDGRTIDFDYDSAGNVTQITPPGRPGHDFTHDAVNQPKDYDPPDLADGAVPTAYSYSDDHELTKITRPDGTDIDLAYDSAGRLETTTEPGGDTTTLSYGSAGGLLKQIQSPQNVTLDLQTDGPLPTKETLSGAVSGDVSRTYDSSFRVEGVKVNGADPVDYSYDDDDLITAAGDLAIGRDPASGRITDTTLDTLDTAVTYNPYGELESESATDPGGDLFSADYVRDDAGRITRKTETTASGTTVWDYSYDAAGRLADVDRDSAEYATYGYNQNSNRTSLTEPAGSTAATYDDQDRLLTYGDLEFGYTKNGELKRREDTASGDVTTYDYDALGNLEEVVLPDGTEISYLWDGLGRRVAKKVDGQLQEGYLYDGSALNPTAVLDDQGSVSARFVYGSSGHVPDYVIKGTDSYRILSDQLGSPRLVVDALSGQIAQQIDYGPFGEVLTDSSPGFQPFGFAGGHYDADTGLVRFGARDYDAEVGRWTAKDPILFGGRQSNLYGYVMSDPVNLVDPSGLILDAIFGSGGVIDDVVPDVVSDFSAGLFDGALGNIPSRAFGIDPDCWGAAHGLGQFGGAVGAGAAGGGALTGALRAKTALGVVGSGSAGGAYAGTVTTAGLNPSATAADLGTGAILGIPGGLAGAGLAYSAQYGDDAAQAAAGIGGAVVSPSFGLTHGTNYGTDHLGGAGTCGC